MAVKLRLVRIGKKKQPTYRVVAADSRSPRNGRFIEIIGTYAPRGTSSAAPDAVIEIDKTKAAKWLSEGAKPTERVEKLLQQAGALDRSAAAADRPAAAAPANRPAAKGTDESAATGTDDEPAAVGAEP